MKINSYLILIITLAVFYLYGASSIAQTTTPIPNSVPIPNTVPIPGGSGGQGGQPSSGQQLLANNAECKDHFECQSSFCAYDRYVFKSFCQNTTNLPLGSICRIDSHCASGRCEFDAIYGVVPHSYCVQIRLPLGVNCSNDSECQSGRCQSNGFNVNKVCVAPIDLSNVPVFGEVEIPPSSNSGGAGGTQPLRLPYRSICKLDSDCINGRCEYYRYTKQSVCVNINLPLGSSCTQDSECQSYKCGDGFNMNICVNRPDYNNAPILQPLKDTISN